MAATNTAKNSVDGSSTLRASVYRTRFPSGWWTIFFIPYLPIGFLLCIWRICTSLQVLLFILIIPESTFKRYLLRVLFSVLGLVVVTKGHVAKTKLMVSNRVSLLDHVALHLAAACVTVSSGDTTPPLAPLFPHWCCSSDNDKDVLEAAQALPEFRESDGGSGTSPYVVQPEPYCTTATHSLLKFSVWPFSLDSTVQPVAMALTRPYPVSLSAADSSGWLDLLFLFFMPLTVFHVSFLPVVYKTSEQTVEEFSCRVQKSIAHSLHISTSQLDADDVRKWLTSPLVLPPTPKPPTPKPPQQEKTQPPQSGNRESSDSGQWREEMDVLEAQVHQVTAVLPHVPHTVIRADLRKTKSVDVTITNLLEGRVSYNPAPPPAKAVSPTSTLRQRGNAAQRQLSLQERKRELLENARRRYKEKHGL